MLLLVSYDSWFNLQPKHEEKDVMLSTKHMCF